jgi:hypothetical protein
MKRVDYLESNPGGEGSDRDLFGTTVRGTSETGCRFVLATLIHGCGSKPNMRDNSECIVIPSIWMA